MSISIQLKTPRLTLVGADEVILDAAIEGRNALQGALGVQVPSDWPPEHLDSAALEWMKITLKKLPREAPWRMYIVLLDASPRVAIGTCGFKGPPDANAGVEIGYSVLPAFRRNGYATEASRALIEVAFSQRATQVAAETYPELVPSIGVMKKCGMVRCGAGSEAGTFRYRVFARGA
ncbi:MAG: GNAT family N-acetyltransferase [Betaproteobacteria bacterium]|nr:GNAT family N-acetyltransferase [Betaproteobacteria bacterium]